MLDYIEMKGVGPAPEMRVNFAPRLNILTGDNGLGKSFVLDVAWWALTRTWAERKVWPEGNGNGIPSIEFKAWGKSRAVSHNAEFDRKSEEWSIKKQGRPAEVGLVLYMRVDGGFSVWDCHRNYYKEWKARDYSEPDRPPAYHFTKKEVWDGVRIEKNRKTEVLCRGLIDDWEDWRKGNEYPFEVLKKVLDGLSPCPEERIQPAKSRRISLSDVRDVPCITTPYGEVPVTLASAGMQRILSLAYLITWAHTEHLEASKILHENPTDRFVILVDEIESHLHPQWQRVVLEALLDVIKELGTEGAIQRGGLYPNIQAIVTTHAPLVMASAESIFCEELDKLHVFDVENRQVTLSEMPWAKQGDASDWLVSKAFGLKRARSREAETAIENANVFMRGESSMAKEEVHRALLDSLPGDDPFWPRWIVKSEGEKSPSAQTGGDA